MLAQHRVEIPIVGQAFLPARQQAAKNGCPTSLTVHRAAYEIVTDPEDARVDQQVT